MMESVGIGKQTQALPQVLHMRAAPGRIRDFWAEILRERSF
jgi:hypothetical protein